MAPMKHVIWRRDVAYIQRRIPRELRLAFTRESEKQPDIYIKYSLEVTRDEYQQNPRGLEALVAEEYKKHIAWFA